MPLPEDGVALIADISGFTPLTEALTQGLSPDQGAEELTRALSGVFTPLIAEIDAFHGSVIKFGGDALIVWYPREPGVRRAAVIRRAITSAWRMQQAIQIHGQVPTPIGIVTLKMKIGLTYGPIKRFNLGLPEYGYEDVLGGPTLDRHGRGRTPRQFRRHRARRSHPGLSARCCDRGRVARGLCRRRPTTPSRPAQALAGPALARRGRSQP